MIHPAVCDVTDVDAVTELVASSIATHGPLDRVVNAAAIAPTQKLIDQPLADIHRLMAVNYGGLVNVTLATLPAMLERGEGDLVQFGSLAGWLPSQWFGAYSASKAAVVSFSETLFHENAGRGVRITCVCPPVVDTPMLEQIKGAAPADFDQAPRVLPEVVLDSIERALEAGDCFAFPGALAPWLWRVRRLAPGLLWRRIDKMERIAG
jgi:NAD(P)-dependent dehydrogenase (short-subunit alcohol dehydrogenase family)